MLNIACPNVTYNFLRQYKINNGELTFTLIIDKRLKRRSALVFHFRRILLRHNFLLTLLLVHCSVQEKNYDRLELENNSKSSLAPAAGTNGKTSTTCRSTS